MRLYRGLKQPYKPEKCAARISAPAQLQGTNFTNCPYRALLYAHSPRGVVLVLDVGPDDPVRVVAISLPAVMSGGQESAGSHRSNAAAVSTASLFHYQNL